jgi:ABC-type lipoprotein export system ATPase subunit
MTESPVLHIAGIRKNYQSLRPLRVRELRIGAGERVAIAGLDAGASEVLVNLVTGASVPDEGDVLVLGRSTRAIADGDAWLASLDRFGIVSPRAVLLDSATLLQNLTMPFTLQIEPVPADVEARVRSLARDVGIEERWMESPIAALPPEVRVRAHLARAVALDPALLILEHPTATVEEAARAPLAADVQRVTSARALATLIISEDADFTRAAAHRSYVLHGASGELRPRKRRFLPF